MCVLFFRKLNDEDPRCLNFVRPCNHDSKKLHCMKVSENDLRRNRKYLYKQKEYVKQNIYLSRLVLPYEPQRRRPRNVLHSLAKPKKFNASYYLIAGSSKTRLQVCKTFFMKALSIGRKRLASLDKTLFDGNVPKENRGGDRKIASFDSRRQSVKNFIAKLPAQESHYDRMKSKREYLSCELNITKLHKIYNDYVSEELRVKLSYFRHIFVTNFNIGFRSPASDVCQLCTLLRNKIKTTNQQEKQHTMTELRVHKLRSNAFYKLLKQDEPDSLTFAFDMQQVQPLPKTPIGEAFYARQISFYALCVVRQDSRNPTFYTWTEDQAGRGACEVGSALLAFLNSLDVPESVKTIRLFCDGCGGQNKNSFIVHTLLFWLAKKSPAHLQQIKLTFPVRGHSFLPCDRVFGRVEKSLRLKPVVTSKEEYHQIYSEHGKVMKLGDETFKLMDVKELDKKKLVGIQNLKRIHFAKSGGGVKVKTYENFFYENDEAWKNLQKRGQRCINNLKELPLKRAINEEKKKDVIKLLQKQFGDDWKEQTDLKWYRDILIEDEEGGIEEIVEECDCLEPDIGLHI